MTGTERNRVISDRNRFALGFKGTKIGQTVFVRAELFRIQDNKSITISVLDRCFLTHTYTQTRFLSKLFINDFPWWKW